MRKHLLALMLTVPALTQVAHSQGYVGILGEQMDYLAASQKNTQWCWAASIQMVLNYYGVEIEQEEIVERSYGRDPYGKLPDWPGSWEVITRNLNNWNVDSRGGYVVQAQMGWGAPPPQVLLSELSQGRPVIIGYNTGSSGHAVVVTAANYTPTFQGPIVNSIVVRDPWPSPQNIRTRGRVEYPGGGLASRIMSYWIIRVSR